MKKAMLKISTITVLSKNEQKKITGSVSKNWDLCCLKEDSPILPPFGCESWIICDGF